MLASFALLLAPQVPQFGEVHRALPEHQYRTRAAVFLDVDGDGDPDLVRGHTTANPEFGVHPEVLAPALLLLLNRGDGTFAPSPAALPDLAVDVSDLAAADLDGDGDRDLAVAAGASFPVLSADANAVLLGDGSGGFTVGSPAVSSPVDATVAVAARDFDGDGDVDLFFANAGGAHRLFLGDGAGNFVDASGQLPAVSDPARGLAVLDHDGDGDLDVFVANEDGRHRLFVNQGAALFTDGSALVQATAGDVHAVAAGDVTGDGRTDLVLSGDLLVGTPAGSLVQAPGAALLAGAFGLALADLDGDGDLDAAATHGAFENIGVGFAALAGDLGGFALLRGDVATADLDADGDTDALLARDTYSGVDPFSVSTIETEDVLLFNDGAGVLVDVREQTAPLVPFVEFHGTDVDLGDLDGDGDLDAFVTNNTDTIDGAFQLKTSLYLNQGQGRFDEANDQLPFWFLATTQVLLADADSDGDLDAFVRGAPNSDSAGSAGYYVNDGTADFSATPVKGIGVGSSATRDLAVGDLDGDGAVDVVAANDPTIEPPSISARAFNDGSGAFSASTADFDAFTDASQAVGLGDLDGDGDLDLYFGNSTGIGPYTSLIASTGQDRVWLGAGDGSFAWSGAALPADTTATGEVRLVDVDQDGDLDVWAGGAVTDLYLNDGTGAFVAAPAGVPLGTRPEFVDYDLDGDADFLSAASDALYANDGGGAFAPVPGALPVGFDGAKGIAVGDVDGDGDPDAFLAASGLNVPVPIFATGSRGEDRLWINFTRHLGWRRAPSIGKALEVDLCAERPHFAFVWLAPLAGQLDVGFGTVWLDPLSAVAFDSTSIGAGCATRSYPVPSAPALVGTQGWLQAVMVPQAGGGLWLTNVEPLPFTSL